MCPTLPELKAPMCHRESLHMLEFPALGFYIKSIKKQQRI